MKTYADWCKEFGWTQTNKDREYIGAIQADAIEAGVEAIRSVARLCGWDHGSAYRAVDALRALKPSPPVVHKKCPCCAAEGIEVGSGESIRIQCTGCYLQTPTHTTSHEAWTIWDARVEGSKG